ncbi:minichromosome maintenance 10 [Perilla frutescens var. hirtella]|nr:minichromosome maintenance 10 [Perilla frutescens var. frutescens]KAH6787962.1 minichromosome maintenance 10 [Perilla frutescens var. hirtella]
MSKSNHQDDLDLLLSLEDRVLETPPASPSGYLSDDGMPKHKGPVDLTAFRDVVQDCLDYDPKDVKRAQNSEKSKSLKEIEIEKFSGLRIRNQVFSRVELSNHLSDIKFVQLPTIKNLLKGDTLAGCWATIGVLTEKGAPRKSSIGQTFAIWKMGCLGEETVSLFLFGDAYLKSSEAKVGTVFALFNCSVRKDKPGTFSLSIFSAKHILKLGTSADMGICQGKGKEGAPCTALIDKRRRKYCNYHSQNSSKKYTSTRTELKGGNLKTGFRDYLKSEGIYVVKPTENNTTSTKSTRPIKLLSVEGLKRALSKADKVTTNVHSQGIRFLNHMTTEKMDHKVKNKAAGLPHQQSRADNSFRQGQEPDAKRLKTDLRKVQEKTTNEVGVKMIELDFPSSDEEV